LSKPRNLDIRALLNAVDRRDSDWLMAQPEAARKEFAPLVVMRWAAGVTDGVAAAYMLWLINHRVNRHLFDLHQYPDLCYRLLASCGLDRSLSREWLAGPQRTTGGNKALNLLAEHHPMANEPELRMLLSLYTRESFAELVSDCGIDKTDAKGYLKAYDKLA
jgi:hypothetical protein